MNDRREKMVIPRSPKSRHRFRWLVLSAFFVVACWGAMACRPRPSIPTPSARTDCHRVEHAAGVTCVPNRIRRLVTLDEASFEYAIALGFQPVGATLSQRSSSYLKDWLDGVETIGQSGLANLERVMALKPDLILGLDYDRTAYAQASRIAPTVSIAFGHSGEWKAVLQRFGTALNREAMARQIVERYNHRLQDLRDSFKETTGSTEKASVPFLISVARVYPNTINLYLRDSFCGTILKDAGFDRPAFQNLSATEAKRRFGNPIQVSVGLELLDLADGDVMFVWTSENTEAGNQIARENLANWQSSSLWRRLNVVKANRVYFVPDYWIGSGPLAANAIIDDLFNYLVKSS